MGKEKPTFGDVIDPRGRGPIERADFFLGLYRGGGETREMAVHMIEEAYGEPVVTKEDISEALAAMGVGEG